MVPVEGKTRPKGTLSTYYKGMDETLDFYGEMHELARGGETPFFESGGQRKYINEIRFVRRLTSVRSALCVLACSLPLRACAPFVAAVCLGPPL